MDPITIVGLILGGGLATEIVRGLFSRRTSASTITGQLYTVWEAELARLTAQTARQIDEINSLHEQITELKELVHQFQALLGAFENEIVALGGDPSRLRHAVRRHLHMGTDEIGGVEF